MLNLLTESLIRVRTADASLNKETLPGVLALLTSDGVTEFPAVRPHQRQAWHAFLVQIGALALHQAGETDPPVQEADWDTLLRALTADWPDAEPWCLISPPDRPALLQSSVPDGDFANFTTSIATPDALDMLVTSRNHDLKAEVMAAAQPDDWLFALLTVQTMEGVMGAGKYGISRMNGGYGSRACVAIVPSGGPGCRFRRDLAIVLRGRTEILKRAPFLKQTGGLGLVWLRRWDGESQITPDELDPFYVEICRRVRLHQIDGALAALSAGSRKPRIAAADLKGNMGDPWAPIEISEAKALSITSAGFSYRLMSELMLGERYKRTLLQEVTADDPSEGLAMIACAIARGQGKTEGYHERIIPISKTVVEGFFRRATEPLARIAEERAIAVGEMRGKVLRSALFSLLQKGPDQVNFDSRSTAAQADPWLRRLDRAADATFFDDLWREAEAEDSERELIRRRWLEGVRDTALELLDDAANATPGATMRRYRARVRARSFFFARLYHAFPNLRPEQSNDDAA